MAKTVEVSLEAYGDQKLTCNFEEEFLKGKNFNDVAEMVLSKNWRGNDARTASIIRKQMSASGGYVHRVAEGATGNTPIRFNPVDPSRKVTDYAETISPDKEQLRFEILGRHRVGYS